MKKVLLFACIIAMAGCSSNNDNNEMKTDSIAPPKTIAVEDSTEESLGKYIYIDAYETAHCTQDCYVIFDREITNEIEGIPLSCGLRRIRISALQDINIAECRFCSRCVNDELYEKIEEMAEGKIKYIDLCP